MNEKISKILFEMSEMLEVEGVPFKPRAYEKAAFSISALKEGVEEIYKKKGTKGLMAIPGVGQGIAERIEEYIKTGKIKDYGKMRKKAPVNVSELSSIEGVGPKLIKLFYEELKIKNIADLEKAARAGKLAGLPRVSAKLQEKILKGIEFHKQAGKKVLLGNVYYLAEKIKNNLEKLKETKKLEIAGSFRRQKETVGDLDFLIATSVTKTDFVAKIMEAFIKMPEVRHVYAKGKTKSMVRLYNGLDADLRVVQEKSFGAALQYFTGNKAHNIKLREIALKKGYKLNEYGLYNKDLKYIAGKTEEEIYEKLGLQYIPPELREDIGEIELSRNNKIPKLVEIGDIKGDLQIQTNFTDGANSIMDYAKLAEELGYEYILITDHTKSLAMTGGLDEDGLLKQMEEIDKLNEAFTRSRASGKRKFKILSGAEVNILKDGSLDIKDEVLEKLDIVGAAVHSYFHLPQKEQTARVIKAMENKNVDIIFHPTGRIIQRRPEIELDFSLVFKMAALTGTILEINSYPNRLDLKDEYIRQAKEYGVKFEISTDAHSITHMDLMRFGIGQARRGGLTKDDVINTLPLEKFLNLFKKEKDKRF